MLLPRVEGFLHRLIRYAAEGNWFLLSTMALAFVCTATALIPVTSIIVAAVLLVPVRWKGVALVTALGSATGATTLVTIFHHMGWSQLYAHFPELTTQSTWIETMDWSQRHGTLALFLIAALPLPQTPALAFFAMTKPDYAQVFLAMLAGKGLKYTVCAWGTAHFPKYIHHVMGEVMPLNTKG